jgi:hypothetical protein
VKPPGATPVFSNSRKESRQSLSKSRQSSRPDALRDIAFEDECDEAQATPTRAGKRVDVVDRLEQRCPVDTAEREAPGL